MINFTDSIVQISSIIIDRPSRQRKELDYQELKDSIKVLGLLEPIIVNKKGEEYYLVAGEQRLASCTELGWTDIPVRYKENMSLLEMEVIQLEENIKRKNYIWQDMVRAVGRIHDLFVEKDNGWTFIETARALSISQSNLSHITTVYRDLDDPRVYACSTYREAYNYILRRQDRKAGDELQKLLDFTVDVDVVKKDVNTDQMDFFEWKSEPTSDYVVLDAPQLYPDLTFANKTEVYLSGETTEDNKLHSTISDEEIDKSIWKAKNTVHPKIPTPPPIICADFREWVRGYEGLKFNIIHCDFPYGIGVFDGSKDGTMRGQKQNHGSTYNDTWDTYTSLVQSFCENINRIMSVSAHVFFWLDAKKSSVDWTLEKFGELAPQIHWARFPLIWHKSDNRGIVSKPDYEPRHIYEICLFGYAGDRKILKVKSDVYSAPTDKTIHLSTKPEPMLRHFLEMVVDEDSRILDPTCGSGSALRAAESLGARTIFGIEQDPENVKLALRELEFARAKRRGNELIGERE